MVGLDRQDLFEAVQHAVVEHFPDVRAIYVFGSTAQGEAWPDSDLDVATLLPRQHPGWDRLTRYQHYREEVRDLLDDFERTGVGYSR